MNGIDLNHASPQSGRQSPGMSGSLSSCSSAVKAQPPDVLNNLLSMEVTNKEKDGVADIEAAKDLKFEPFSANLPCLDIKFLIGILEGQASKNVLLNILHKIADNNTEHLPLSRLERLNRKKEMVSDLMQRYLEGNSLVETKAILKEFLVPVVDQIAGNSFQSGRQGIRKDYCNFLKLKILDSDSLKNFLVLFNRSLKDFFSSKIVEDVGDGFLDSEDKDNEQATNNVVDRLDQEFKVQSGLLKSEAMLNENIKLIRQNVFGLDIQLLALKAFMYIDELEKMQEDVEDQDLIISVINLFFKIHGFQKMQVGANQASSSTASGQEAASSSDSSGSMSYCQNEFNAVTEVLKGIKEYMKTPVKGVPVQPDASSNKPHFDVIVEKLDQIYDLMKSQQTAPAQSSAPSPISVQIQRSETEAVVAEAEEAPSPISVQIQKSETEAVVAEAEEAPSPISVQIQRPETEAAQAAAAAAQAEAAAATTIQSRIRGNQARRQAAAEAAQAAEAQAAEEASLRTLVQINDEAKQKIKKIISQQIQEAEKEAEKKAARKIQAHTRELIARNKARRNEAAKTIQKHRRRMITKNRADCLREQKKAAEKEQAATTIQAPLTRNQVRGRAKNEAALQQVSLSGRESQISASETNTVILKVPASERKAMLSSIRPAGVAPQSVSSSEAPYAIIRIGDSIMYTRSRILAYK